MLILRKLQNIFLWLSGTSFNVKPWRVLAVASLYVLLQIIGMVHHEVWLDEAQHFLLARDSHSISELIYNSRYEGHPLLWNLMLYVVTRFTDQPLVMQLLHTGIASLCAIIILTRAPFRFRVRVLICFGHFLMYEYALLNRNYSIALLLVLLILITQSRHTKNPILTSLLLGLLMNAHLFAAFFALAFLPFLISDLREQSWKVRLCSLVLLTLAALLLVSHSIPPPDHFLVQVNEHPALSSERAGRAIKTLVQGMLPLPDFGKANYFGNHLFDNSAWLYLPFSLCVFLLPAFFLYKHRKSFILFYGCSLLVLVFISQTSIHHATRHGGFMSVALFAACWLTHIHAPNPLFHGLYKSKDHRLANAGRWFGTVLLVVQCVSGILCYSADLGRDFSAAKKTALYLNGLPKTSLIVLSHFSSGPAISIYCSRPIFYLETAEFGSFCKWNTHPMLLDSEHLRRRLDSLLQRVPDFFFVSTVPDIFMTQGHAATSSNIRITLLATFDKSVIQSERYWVYHIRSQKPATFFYDQNLPLTKSP